MMVEKFIYIAVYTITQQCSGIFEPLSTQPTDDITTLYFYNWVTLC